MSFKEFSSTHDVPVKGGAGNKAKDAPAADTVATESGKTPTEVAQTHKS